jgi:cytochrome c oxidase cbb3-type subunit 3
VSFTVRFRRVVATAVLGAVSASAGIAADDTSGRQIYNFRCYFCHGYSGDARTLAAQMLAPVPRDFTSVTVEALSREAMLDAVRQGRPGTAMKPFASLLSEREIAAVVDFVREEFMVRKARNTRYHTVANGWPDHERFAAAFPFVRGEIPLDADEGRLTPTEQAGRRLYMRSCVSCHDLARRMAVSPSWEAEAVSYPRTGFATGDFLDPPDAHSGATTFARHDIAPQIDTLDADVRRGEALYQANCAFCHAADGTGKNWIGSFMVPHPRDLTSATAMAKMTPDRLTRVIKGGLPGTSMPAWGGVLGDSEIHSIVRYIDVAFHRLLDD